jgi:hypothetical protein
MQKVWLQSPSGEVFVNPATITLVDLVSYDDGATHHFRLNSGTSQLYISGPYPTIAAAITAAATAFNQVNVQELTATSVTAVILP